MFKLHILSLFFLFAFAGSKAFKQTSEPNSNVEKYYEDDKNGQFKDHHSGDINILLKDDGEVDLKLPEHAKYYHFDEDENDEAPLLMKRGKGKGKGRWKGRGRYRGGGWSNKPWKNRNYGNYGGYGGGGPGGYYNDW